MSDPIVTFGGPLFRRPGTSSEDFSISWRRHAQIVTPWFLHYGVEEYIQIHISPSPGVQTSSKAVSASLNHIPTEVLTAAQNTLAQADGIAIVRCRPVSVHHGETRTLAHGSSHLYFRDVIAVDERRFLHAESGATAVMPDNGKPLLDIPSLEADAWRMLATQCSNLHIEEFVVIKDGKGLLGINEQWKDLWHDLNAKNAPEGPPGT